MRLRTAFKTAQRLRLILTALLLLLMIEWLPSQRKRRPLSTTAVCLWAVRTPKMTTSLYLTSMMMRRASSSGCPPSAAAAMSLL